ncbi:MAG: hypothetical protein ACRENE_18075 [Polyangiaceae bacterium]
MRRSRPGARSTRGAAKAAALGFALLGWVCAAAGAGCKRTEMASPAQCESLLERFIDLKLSEDKRAVSMSSEDRAHLRAQIASDVTSDSDVQQVTNQCQTEVTAIEYKCAIAAETSKVWNDCIN